MTPKHFRNLSLLFCAAGLVVAALGLYGFYLRAEWLAELNAAAPAGQVGGLEITAPEWTTKALYIAGLLMALSGCFHLKAEADRMEEGAESAEMSDEG